MSQFSPNALQVTWKEESMVVISCKKDEQGNEVWGHRYIVGVASEDKAWSTTINFQNGPVGEDKKHNGLTNEVLIQILEHRITVLNNKFKCPENDMALAALAQARAALDARTLRRIRANKEGKMVE